MGYIVRTIWKSIGFVCLNICLPLLVGYVVWHFINRPAKFCRQNLSTGAWLCRPQCNKGEFSLHGMRQCMPYLTCADMDSSSVKMQRILDNGAVKKVFLADWKDHVVVLNIMRTSEFYHDFQHGLNMLVKLSPEKHVTQLIGHCQQEYITEYHHLGSALNFPNILISEKYQHLDTAAFRLGMCVRYTEVLQFLHTSPIGVRVMCDSNTLEKTLSQFLLSESLDLIANDLDALPEVKPGSTIKCGPRQLYGTFVAPEQLWPHENEAFKDSKMPGYNEKTDIWKIPDVCNFFLGKSPDAQSLGFHLFQIHKQCKSEDPAERPTAVQVAQHYLDLVRDLELL